jgi:hypothetical protein
MIQLARIHSRFMIPYIPNFVLYSVPDGAWVYSSTATLMYIWKDKFLNFWVFVPVVLAIITEILQIKSINLVMGTFHMFDAV